MTIYLDEASMREIKQSARRENVSVSRWARLRLCEAARHTWPADYFELFGALSDSDLSRPHQPDLATDAERQTL